VDKKLKIMAPVRYPWQFNGPRQSRHDISIRYFLPLNKISEKIEGITVFNPFPFENFDLVHAFNRIPVGIKPFIIGFESHLPRAYGLEKTAYYRALGKSLAGKRCKGIIAISEYARRHFIRQHKDQPWFDAVKEKLTIRYPNMPIPATPDAFEYREGEPIRLVFVGSHFGRKGGSVSVRLVALAQQRNFPMQVDIVSSLEVGAASWIDPLQPDFFEEDFRLLRSLPNIKHHGSLPNKDVLALVAKAHFVLLPTFSDSFGYSAIEAMANYTPVIATRQGALPEFIEDGVSGLMLELENDDVGEWKHIVPADRNAPVFATFFNSEIDRLTHEAYAKIESLMKNPQNYVTMRKAARASAEKLFSAADANIFWDNYYIEALAR
jgi:glycosyltransferase involved in cell wall biosynthesis